MRKLDVLATQIGNFGITAAAGVLAINCLGYTFHALQDGGFGEGGLLPHLQVCTHQKYGIQGHKTCLLCADTCVALLHVKAALVCQFVCACCLLLGSSF